ncbi:MAG: transcriptional regulator [Gammaproteobacteria bacterium]|nr:transcriptional regulator [Gammaproteobacteria bacterium]|tara:strand:- start:8622 stop:8912 length:291 start_codon:yes stop_codon:yes gene_type:complete
MPIYEYRCDNCGHEVEVLQKISEAPLVNCPECLVDGLKKKISAAGFRLKGGGWYETDFKSGDKKNVAPTDKSSGSAATSSSDSKSSTSSSADSGSS